MCLLRKPYFITIGTHSPRVFIDEHGEEVDIWAVGELIFTSGILDLSLELSNLGKWMKSEPAPSAK